MRLKTMHKLYGNKSINKYEKSKNDMKIVAKANLINLIIPYTNQKIRIL